MTTHFHITPYGMFHYGSQFHDRVGDLAVPRPTVVQLYLLGHALELYLKAFLLYRGPTVQQVRKLSHRLTSALSSAKSQGLGTIVSVTPGLESQVKAFDRH